MRGDLSSPQTVEAALHGVESVYLMWPGLAVEPRVVKAIAGQASRSLIHERDIADVAVHTLTSPGHDGAKYVITGPESIPQAELVGIIGEAVGREVR